MRVPSAGDAPKIVCLHHHANSYYTKDWIIGSMFMPKSEASRKVKRKAKVKKVKRKVKKRATAAKRKLGKGLMGLGKKLSS